MTNNTILNGNNIINGGKEIETLNATKMAGFKAIGLEGLYKMAAFNPGLMSDPEFLAVIAELNPVTSPKTEGNTSDNIKGGIKMETKNAESKTNKNEGGKTMKETVNKQGGTEMKRVYKLSSLQREGYMDGVTYILKHFGRKGVYMLEEIGVKVVATSVKEKAALKDLVYRAAVVAGTEWIKNELDNDIIDFAGSVIQTYQVVRAGMDLYKVYKSFNKITLKDIEALDELIDSLINEEKAYDKEDNEEEDC